MNLPINLKRSREEQMLKGSKKGSKRGHRKILIA
jgi:hypothetical protein